MIPEPITQIALIVAIIAVILDKTLPWIAKKKNGGWSTEDRLKYLSEKVAIITPQIRDLHHWHNKEDADGVKVWYIRQSLEQAIAKLGDTLERQTIVMEALARNQEMMLNKMQQDQESILRELKQS